MNVHGEDQMPLINVFLLLFFWIGLPTADFYTDVVFIWTLFDEGHSNFAIVSIAPLVLSFLFILQRWWKIEANMKNRLKTLPFLILQVWPQYCISRVLYLGLVKKDISWRKESEIIKWSISSVGKPCQFFFIPGATLEIISFFRTIYRGNSPNSSIVNVSLHVCETTFQ